MKRINYFIVSILAILVLTSCKENGKFLQSIIGSPYEVLVIVDNKTWKNESGEALFNLLESDVPSLPQKEPNFNVSHCTPAEFTSLYKPTRNIVFVEVDNAKYTKGSVIFSSDKWASPQALVKIVAPDDTTFINLLKANGQEIINYLVKAELDRMKSHFNEHSNENFMAMIQKQFGISLTVPHYINKYKQGKDVFWMSTGSAEVRQDMLIYSYSYTDIKMLTEEYLLQKRDSVNKMFIAGPVEDSYVGTDYKYDKPVFKEIWVDDKYCAEIRGLWKVYGKASMGGPFISHTRIDELHQRVITIEAFIYAPGKSKRNSIRQLEAVLYTAKLPVVLDDVIITAEKEKK